MTGSRHERGSATVLVLALVVALLAAGALLAGWGAVIVVRHRAASAADTAALVAASQAVSGEHEACLAAGRAAAALGATLTACEVRDAVADVTVAAAAPTWLAWAGVARLNARAGPAETYPEKPPRPALAS